MLTLFYVSTSLRLKLTILNGHISNSQRRSGRDVCNNLSFGLELASRLDRPSALPYKYTYIRRFSSIVLPSMFIVGMEILPQRLNHRIEMWLYRAPFKLNAGKIFCFSQFSFLFPPLFSKHIFSFHGFFRLHNVFRL